MITTVVGNYPKVPPLFGGGNLRRALAQYDEGRITAEELARVEDEATRDAIQEQVQAGIDLVSDGQIRWEDGQTYLARRIGGFSIDGLIRYFDTNTYYRQPIAEGPLSWRGPISVAHYRFAAQASARLVKAIITGPFTLAKLSRDTTDRPFSRFVLALAAILNQEARALQEAGAPIVQVDEPALLKYKEEFSLFQEAMGVLTEGLSVKKALYTYFGDVSGLVPPFLALPFQVFGLDFVMGPANYDFLEGFPKDKELGLGIVDARNTKMERVEQIVEAIGRVRPWVSLERLYINPSCGLEFLPRHNAYDKLVRLVEGTRRAQEVFA